MLSLPASTITVLHRELLASLDSEHARGVMMRLGYSAGSRDAALAREQRPDAKLLDGLIVDQRLRGLAGAGVVAPVRVEMDVDRGSFYGEFVCKESAEDEEYLGSGDYGSGPACWMQVGYASGYTSTFVGLPVLYREVECRATGAVACRLVGRPANEWDDARFETRFLGTEPLTEDRLVPGATPPGLGPRQLAPASAQSDMVGISAGFDTTCQLVRRVAPTRATVLLLGENGVGKEVFARYLHRIGRQSSGPFVAVNCAALPEALVESELFGVERGAFTGATHGRPGRFERAHGGTLFLDEIGTLSLGAQGKLLRALQEGEIERIGDHKTRRVTVRVVSATNLNLKEAVAQGRFREDLFFRLNVVPIKVPPLRERREDIPLLMNHFLERFVRRHGRAVSGFTPGAAYTLLNYDWPGNIRELQNIVERGVILAPEGSAIDVAHLFIGGESGHDHSIAREPLAAARIVDEQDGVNRVCRKVRNLLLGVGDDTDPTSLDEIEDTLLSRAVQIAHGNVAAASRILGLTRPQLVYRLKVRRIRV